MAGLWKFFFWGNHAVIAVNTFLFSCFLIPIDSWYIMPCLIVTAICMAPIFYSLILWSVIKGKNIGHLYLCRLFFRKTIMSLPLVLLIFAWSWWGGGMAILVGGIVASWLGNIIFWTSKRHDLSAVLPEMVVSRQPLRYQLTGATAGGHEPVLSAMVGSMQDCGNNTVGMTNAADIHSTPYMASAANIDTHRYDAFNPASGLPMVNSAFDYHGNAYGTSSAIGDF